MLRAIGQTAAILALWAGPAAAEGLSITADLPEVRLVANGQDVTIARSPSEASDSAIATACPPDCVQPMQATPGGQTLGALEVIGFLRAKVVQKAGLLLDVRLPGDYAAGHVPGAINVPLATLVAQNPYRKDILLALGAREGAGVLDFATAPMLVIYATGSGNDMAANAVRALAEAGYPVEMVLYFRGGLQEWRQLGLSVVGAADQG